MDSTTSWTTTSTTSVAADASTTNGVGQFQVFTCFQREPVEVRNFCYAQNSAANDYSSINIALDGTNVSQATYQAYVANGKGTVSCSWSQPQLGLHTYARQNFVQTGGTGTFYGGTQGFAEGDSCKTKICALS